MNEHSDKRDSSKGPDGLAGKGDAPKLLASPSIAPGRGENDASSDGEESNKLIVVHPSRTGWNDKTWEEAVRRADPDESFHAAAAKGGRSMGFVVTMVLLAAVVGVAGGALATGNLTRMAGENKAKVAAAAHSRSMGEAVARMESEIASLKQALDKANKQAAGQISKANERIAQMEKSQAEPAARIAKLSDAVDKLAKVPATPPAPVPAPVATAPVAVVPPVAVAALPKPDPRDVTGSINRQPSAPPQAQTPAQPKIEISRMPIVPGWSLVEVHRGIASVEGRHGIYDVVPGDTIPGLGRVDAIRKQDGRWVVVTNRGLIVD